MAKRVKAKVLPLAANPRPPGSIRLSGPSGLYRLRVGDYRVIYRVDDARRVVEITVVAHRREVYRDL